eukprot:jgi/Mesvir1/15528/Mv03179-RA.1
MGVTSLWDLVAEYGEKASTVAQLRKELAGKRVAVDLSYWICAAIGALGNNPAVVKPHMRVIFFRAIKMLTTCSALPVFVVDGCPPSLKNQARLERFRASCNSGRGPTYGRMLPRGQKGGHWLGGHGFDSAAAAPPLAYNQEFKRVNRETVAMLRLMGFPVVFAEGEAEALCAELNKQGLVDAVVSPDSDTLVHGARTVIKELTMNNNKDASLELYRASTLEANHLHQEHLVALALCLGCDYDKAGLPHVGATNARRLVAPFNCHQVLPRLREMSRGILPDLNAHPAMSLGEYGDNKGDGGGGSSKQFSVDDDQEKAAEEDRGPPLEAALGLSQAKSQVVDVDADASLPSVNLLMNLAFTQGTREEELGPIPFDGAALRSARGDVASSAAGGDAPLLARKEPHCSVCGLPGTKREHEAAAAAAAGGGAGPLGQAEEVALSPAAAAAARAAQMRWWSGMSEKMRQRGGFPDERIIAAFTTPARDCKGSSLAWSPPNVRGLQALLVDNTGVFLDKSAVAKGLLPLLAAYALQAGDFPPPPSPARYASLVKRSEMDHWAVAPEEGEEGGDGGGRWPGGEGAVTDASDGGHPQGGRHHRGARSCPRAPPSSIPPRGAPPSGIRTGGVAPRGVPLDPGRSLWLHPTSVLSENVVDGQSFYKLQWSVERADEAGPPCDRPPSTPPELPIDVPSQPAATAGASSSPPSYAAVNQNASAPPPSYSTSWFSTLASGAGPVAKGQRLLTGPSASLSISPSPSSALLSPSSATDPSLPFADAGVGSLPSSDIDEGTGKGAALSLGLVHTTGDDDAGNTWRNVVTDRASEVAAPVRQSPVNNAGDGDDENGGGGGGDIAAPQWRLVNNSSAVDHDGVGTGASGPQRRHVMSLDLDGEEGAAAPQQILWGPPRRLVDSRMMDSHIAGDDHGDGAVVAADAQRMHLDVDDSAGAIDGDNEVAVAVAGLDRLELATLEDIGVCERSVPALVAAFREREAAKRSARESKGSRTGASKKKTGDATHDRDRASSHPPASALPPESQGDPPLIKGSAPAGSRGAAMDVEIGVAGDDEDGADERHWRRKQMQERGLEGEGEGAGEGTGEEAERDEGEEWDVDASSLDGRDGREWKEKRAVGTTSDGRGGKKEKGRTGKRKGNEKGGSKERTKESGKEKKKDKESGKGKGRKGNGKERVEREQTPEFFGGEIYFHSSARNANADAGPAPGGGNMCDADSASRRGDMRGAGPVRVLFPAQAYPAGPASNATVDGARARCMEAANGAGARSTELDACGRAIASAKPSARWAFVRLAPPDADDGKGGGTCGVLQGGMHDVSPGGSMNIPRGSTGVNLLDRGQSVGGDLVKDGNQGQVAQALPARGGAVEGGEEEVRGSSGGGRVVSRVPATMPDDVIDGVGIIIVEDSPPPTPARTAGKAMRRSEDVCGLEAGGGEARLNAAGGSVVITYSRTHRGGEGAPAGASRGMQSEEARGMLGSLSLLGTSGATGQHDENNVTVGTPPSSAGKLERKEQTLNGRNDGKPPSIAGELERKKPSSVLMTWRNAHPQGEASPSGDSGATAPHGCHDRTPPASAGKRKESPIIIDLANSDGEGGDDDGNSGEEGGRDEVVTAVRAAGHPVDMTATASACFTTSSGRARAQRALFPSPRGALGGDALPCADAGVAAGASDVAKTAKGAAAHQGTGRGKGAGVRVGRPRQKVTSDVDAGILLSHATPGGASHGTPASTTRRQKQATLESLWG